MRHYYIVETITEGAHEVIGTYGSFITAMRVAESKIATGVDVSVTYIERTLCKHWVGETEVPVRDAG